MPHLTLTQLEARLHEVREAPADEGTVKLIVRRPEVEERELLDSAELDRGGGLLGDGWSVRGSSSTADGGPDPEAEVTVMSARAAALVADGDDPARWALAGDQLYVDLDLSQENLPPGTRLAVGTAVLEVSEEPHLGCGKFSRRFGVEALKFVNSAEGRTLRLRGLNARVIEPGTVRRGDPIAKRPAG